MYWDVIKWLRVVNVVLVIGAQLGQALPPVTHAHITTTAKSTPKGIVHKLRQHQGSQLRYHALYVSGKIPTDIDGLSGLVCAIDHIGRRNDRPTWGLFHKGYIYQLPVTSVTVTSIFCSTKTSSTSYQLLAKTYQLPAKTSQSVPQRTKCYQLPVLSW